MKRTALLMTLLFAAGTSAYAETEVASAQDSPLVAAAKRAMARRQAAAKATPVITNETVARSTKILTTSKGAAPIPDFTAKDYYSAGTSSSAPAPAAGNVATSGASTSGRFLPQRSQNTGYDAAAPRTAQNSTPTQPRNPASDGSAPRVAANSSYGPAPSQNAGPSGVPRP